jgi:hypothetical protein
MWPDAPPSTAGHHATTIELHLFVPGADGTHISLLQEDDGLTFAALHGTRYRTTFQVTRTGNHLTLRADVEGDGYPEFAREQFHLIIHGAQPDTIQLAEAPVRARPTGVSYCRTPAVPSPPNSPSESRIGRNIQPVCARPTRRGADAGPP